MGLLKENPENYLKFPNKAKSNRDLTLWAVSQKGIILKYTSFKSNKRVVWSATFQDGLAFEFAADKLKKDKKFILSILKESGKAFQFISPELKRDEDVIIAAVKKYRHSLNFIDFDLLNDKHLFLKLVAIDGLSLEYASDSLKADKDIVNMACSNNLKAIYYSKLGDEKDREIVKKYESKYWQKSNQYFYEKDIFVAYPTPNSASLNDYFLTINDGKDDLKIHYDFFFEYKLTKRKNHQTETLKIYFCSFENAIVIAKKFFSLPNFFNYELKNKPQGQKYFQYKFDDLKMGVDHEKFTIEFDDYDQPVKFDYVTMLKHGNGANFNGGAEKTTPNTWVFKKVTGI